MLRLQDEAKKVAKYRHTARQQEQIITRLEQLMQASLKDAKGARAQASELQDPNPNPDPNPDPSPNPSPNPNPNPHPNPNPTLNPLKNPLP